MMQKSQNARDAAPDKKFYSNMNYMSDENHMWHNATYKTTKKVVLICERMQDFCKTDHSYFPVINRCNLS